MSLHDNNYISFFEIIMCVYISCISKNISKRQNLLQKIVFLCHYT